MKRLIYLLACVIVGLNASAQLAGVVIDAASGLPVPYVNLYVLNSQNGATTDSVGRFSIYDCNPGDTLVVSSIGYVEKKVSLADAGKPILLAPKVYEMTEINVMPRSYNKQLVVNKLRKKEVNGYFKSTRPSIVARYFPYRSNYAATGFIKEIRVFTKSDLPGATFNVRLFLPDSKGEPGGDLLREAVLAEAKKGKDVLRIDLSEYSLPFPSLGLFVGVEWLMIDRNKKDFVYNEMSTSSTVNTYSYDPQFGSVRRTVFPDTWSYSGGNWHKVVAVNMDDGITKMYFELAVELTLTN